MTRPVHLILARALALRALESVPRFVASLASPRCTFSRSAGKACCRDFETREIDEKLHHSAIGVLTSSTYLIFGGSQVLSNVLSNLIRAAGAAASAASSNTPRSDAYPEQYPDNTPPASNVRLRLPRPSCCIAKRPGTGGMRPPSGT